MSIVHTVHFIRYICTFMYFSNQPIMWRQHNAFFIKKWLAMARSWYQMGWFECFNGWSPGDFTHSSLSSLHRKHGQKNWKHPMIPLQTETLLEEWSEQAGLSCQAVYSYSNKHYLQLWWAEKVLLLSSKKKNLRQTPDYFFSICTSAVQKEESEPVLMTDSSLCQTTVGPAVVFCRCIHCKSKCFVHVKMLFCSSRLEEALIRVTISFLAAWIHLATFLRPGFPPPEPSLTKCSLIFAPFCVNTVECFQNTQTCLLGSPILIDLMWNGWSDKCMNVHMFRCSYQSRRLSVCTWNHDAGLNFYNTNLSLPFL